jgi:hypothetical protein
LETGSFVANNINPFPRTRELMENSKEILTLLLLQKKEERATNKAIITF